MRRAILTLMLMLTWGSALGGCFPDVDPAKFADTVSAGDTEAPADVQVSLDTVEVGETAEPVDGVARLAAPEGVDASGDRAADVELRWQERAGASGYHVERCDVDDCAPEAAWDRLTLTVVVATRYEDAEVEGPGTPSAPSWVVASVDRPNEVVVTWAAVVAPEAPRYRYRVVAVGAAGESAPSAVAEGHRADLPVVGYEVRVDGDVWREVAGGAATAWQHAAAGPPRLGAVTVTASQGAYAEFVRVAVANAAAEVGSTHSYQVRALTIYGPAPSSAAVSGRRSAGPLVLSWERSAGTAPEGFVALPGVSTVSFDDAGAPADGSVRWYRVTVRAEGAVDVVSEPAAGARQPPVCAPACQHGGPCAAPNVCDCAGTGYAGATCEMPVCSASCQNGGPCTAPNVCDCTGTGYTGATCAVVEGTSCQGTSCPGVPDFTASCNSQGYCEYARTSSSASWHADDAWIYVPPGSFPMGSPESEAGSLAAERPVHTVTFAAGFLIGKYEVTVRTYEACEAASPGSCTVPSVADWDGEGWGVNRTGNGRGAHPQNGLTWSQSVAMCGWLGGRLPSESEWEYAAKGPATHRKYPWGDTPEPTCANGTAVMDDGGGLGCGTGGTWDLGSKAAGASAVGALDMAGNVWEWVEDWKHDDYTGAPADGSAWMVPSGSDRVLRGGGFSGTAPFLRAADRHFDTPAIRIAAIGARCLRPLP